MDLFNFEEETIILLAHFLLIKNSTSVKLLHVSINKCYVCERMDNNARHRSGVTVHSSFSTFSQKNLQEKEERTRNVQEICRAGR